MARFFANPALSLLYQLFFSWMLLSQSFRPSFWRNMWRVSQVIGRFDNTWLFNVVLSGLPKSSTSQTSCMARRSSWTFCKVCPRCLYFFSDCDLASATSKNWSIKVFFIKVEEICGSTYTTSPDIWCTMCFLEFIVHLSKI